MKIKGKGLMTVAVALLMIAVIVPVYAQSQSGTLDRIREPDPECSQEGATTRPWGDEPPVQAQVEKPEKLTEEEILEENETPIQEQTQTQEQLRDCNCESEECEQCQFQYQEQYRGGQEED
jgi:hypothetical protein